MKNLLTFMSPEYALDHNHRKMLEIQIENSLDYWKPEDILLTTNFPYEYKGIKATVIPDLFNSQWPANPRAIINSKINIFIYLIENKIITETTFYHDFDSFQIAPIGEDALKKDLGCTCYGIYPPWIFQSWGKSTGKLKMEMKETQWGYPRRINFGNVFIKPESLDILRALLERMDKEGLYEEDAMSLMLNEGQFEDRVQIMDPGYNLGIRCTKANVLLAERSVMAHFPPQNQRWHNKMWFLLNDKLRKMIADRFEYKNILITGSKGFIGTHLLNYLYNGAYPVKGITEDIRDKEALRPYFKEAEFVIHTAAKLEEGTSKEEYHSVNVDGTRNVAELCLEYGCKMIHFGTISRQGEYGKSKKEAQQVVEEYSKKGLKALVLRLCQVTEEPREGCYPIGKLKDDIQRIIRFHDFDKYEIKEYK